MKDWVTFIYFKLKGTRWKTDLDEIVADFDNHHDKQRIKLHWGCDDTKILMQAVQESVWELYCSLSICLNHFCFGSSACFAYEKTVINEHRVEKSAFEDQPQENYVWIIKWRTFLGIFCNKSFTPTVTSFYQVHADAHILICAATMLLMCHWCQNLAAVNCILHWCDVVKLTKRISQSSPNRWKMVHFYVLCSKNILTKLVGYQQPTSLCVKMDFVVGTISLSCELFSLSKARTGLSRCGCIKPLASGDPHTMVVGHVVHFCQIILPLKNYRNGFQISLLEYSYLVWKDDDIALRSFVKCAQFSF